MSWRSRRSACSAFLVALAMFSPGCGKDSTTAPPPPAPSVGVTGVATKENGAPAAGAVLWLEAAHAARPARVDRLRAVASGPARAQAGRAAAGSTDELRSTIADANGRFAFANVAAGDYILTCRLPDHLAATTAVHVHEAGASADTVFVQVKLAPSGRLGGRATLDGATSHNGIVVYLQGTSTVAITDPSGEYAMRDVPLGTWTVVATRAGYIDASTPATLSAAGDSVRVADLVLPRDLNQAPVASISVSGLCHGYPTELSPAGSHDDGTIVRYEWSFENDGRIDSTTSQPIQILHSYSPGDHRAKLIVTDDHGSIGINSAPFHVNTPDSVFVSATTGTPGGTGSRNSPLNTISAAMALLDHLSPCVKVVMIAAGDYPEELVIPDGQMRIRGGLDATTWTRAAGQYSVVHHASNNPNVTGGYLDVVVTGMMFRGDWNDASTSTIAFVAYQCVGQLRFEDCRFVASPGQSGATGAAGAAGLNGAPGGPGGSDGRGGDGACIACSGHYGSCGGQGGTGTLQVGGNGGDAFGQYCVSDPPAHGGAGGAAAPACGVNGSPGAPGERGLDGNEGTGGSGIFSSGEIHNEFGLTWKAFRGNQGSDGGRSFPGGGGGAGGGNACPGGWPGGGGGGGGGAALGGVGGLGGFSGGASIAILLYEASPQFVDCSIEAADGGAGGPGGQGGAGGASGAGGAGGQGRNGGALGGDGGAGGKGGDGGGGQGGAGGPSWCVAKTPASSPLFTGCKFSFGAGGTGGEGGLNGAGLASGTRGPDGPAGNFGP